MVICIWDTNRNNALTQRYSYALRIKNIRFFENFVTLFSLLPMEFRYMPCTSTYT